jgi:thioredoxin reductase
MKTYDVVIIGASFAGLAAATQLGRARRSILLIDDGKPRNRFAEHSHGFLTRDGSTPSEILSIAREQLSKYKTVDFVQGRALSIQTGDVFEVKADESYFGRRIILAHGMKDILPDIPGLADLWGTSVFNCPYCHGYELGDRPLGVLGNNEVTVHQAMMLPDWSKDVILFTNGPATFDEETMDRFMRRGLKVEQTEIVRLVSLGGLLHSIELADGRFVKREGLLIAPRMVPAASFADDLNLEMEKTPMGSYIKTDARKETSMKYVFAAGDLARMPHSVTFAAADGVMAGVGAHQSLLTEDWA